MAGATTVGRLGVCLVDDAEQQQLPMVERMALTLAVDVQQGHVCLRLLRLEILYVISQPGEELALGLRVCRLKVLAAVDCSVKCVFSAPPAFIR